MKRIINMALTLAVILALGVLFTDSASAQEKGTKTQKEQGKGQYFSDQDGDGICDNVGTKMGQKSGNGMKGKGNGPKDGTGNKGVGPKDGTGYGSGNGTGVCDGTGPKGTPQRGRK